MHEVSMESASLTPWIRLSGLPLAVGLAVVGTCWLLPRPRGRFLAGGVAALIAAGVVLGSWLQERWGRPWHDAVGTALFVLFATGALLGGTTLVVQRNPARGAIAFAFAILGVCGLFLLLAAPFLMAATVIVYAGAIIVTFLFVLMLSRTAGPSDENDRSREPLLGSLTGYAFAGLVLWLLHVASPPNEASHTVSSERGGTDRAKGDATRTNAPVEVAAGAEKAVLAVLTREERQKLREALHRLDEATAFLEGDLRRERERRIEYFEALKDLIVQVVGASREDENGALQEGTLPQRLVPRVHPTEGGVSLYRADVQTRRLMGRVAEVRAVNWYTYKQVEGQLLAERPDREVIARELEALRRQLLMLLGEGEMPARTVSNLGYLLYSDYLLAVELAAVVLLIATVGAVAVAQRQKGEAA